MLAQHNLVTDGSFNEFHLIVCRNVMIYFGSELQEEVLQLFGDSMTRFGILALGRKESIRRSRHAAEYEAARRGREDLPQEGVMAVEVVAIGASWGGLHAVECVLETLPEDFPAAVVIAQHRRSDSDQQPARRACSRRAARCRSATPRTSRRSSPGPCSSRPPTTTCSSSAGSVALSVDAPLHYSRPSIDVLLGSAADAYGERAAGVVLTGANADGADGLARIASRGGVAIVQDPETAMRREMPEAALAATPGARVLALEEIGPLLGELARTREGAQS